MRLSINEVRLQMHLHLLNRPGLLSSLQQFSPSFCNLRLDANAAIKAVRKGIMYDVRRRTSRVTTWAYRLAPAARTTDFQAEEENEEKDEGETHFLRSSSSLPSIHLARPGQRNETDTRIERPVYRVLERNEKLE